MMKRAAKCTGQLSVISFSVTPLSPGRPRQSCAPRTGHRQRAGSGKGARGQAIASYLAYRRAGGESQSNQAQIFARIFQAIQQGTTTEAEQLLDKWSAEDDPLWANTLAAGLQAILRGDRDPALATDPNLDYRNAAELQLLLEALGE